MKKLIIHKYIVEILNILPELQRGKVLGLLIAYNETGIMPTTYDDDIAPAMQSIKETLQHIENISKVRSNVGKKGGNPFLVKQNKDLVKQNPILDNQNTPKTNILVKQNPILDNQTENSDNIYNINNNTNRVNSKKEKKNKKEKCDERAKIFYESLIPFIDNPYPKEMLREFYDYWSEPNKSHTKMRFEQERTWDLRRRLARWANNDKKRNYGTSRPAKPTLEETAADLVESYLNGSRTTPSISDFG